MSLESWKAQALTVVLSDQTRTTTSAKAHREPQKQANDAARPSNAKDELAETKDTSLIHGDKAQQNGTQLQNKM